MLRHVKQIATGVKEALEELSRENRQEKASLSFGQIESHQWERSGDADCQGDEAKEVYKFIWESMPVDPSRDLSLSFSRKFHHLLEQTNRTNQLSHHVVLHVRQRVHHTRIDKTI